MNRLTEIKDLLPPENRLLWGGEDVALRKPRAKNQHAEGEIQRSVLAYLRLHRNVAWVERFNSGAMKLMDKYGRQRFVRFAFPGCSDILGQMKDGRLLAIEVKALGGKLTSAQRAFLDLVRDNGGVSGVAYSVDDVDEILK